MQRRNSTLCPNCRRLISLDEEQCPYCGIRRPAAWYRNNALMRGFSFADPIQVILYVSIAVFVLSILINFRGMSMRLSPFSFLSPSNESLLLLGASGSIPVYQLGMWWSIITANYLHGGLLHIFFNMSALRQVGPLVITEYGPYRTFSLYTLTGALGFLASVFAGVPFTVGASASLCGLIGALLYYGKSRGGHWGQMVYRQTTGWIVGLVLFGFLVPGINNWAHGGGLVSGIALGFVFGYAEKRREGSLDKMLAIVCVLVTVAALAWGILRAVTNAIQ